MCKILKFAYYRNYCADYNQILHSHKDHQILFVGGSNTRKTNPRWRTASILKIENRPYFRNGLPNLRKIWHADAYWASERDRQLKVPTFENPRWRTAAILKKGKSAIEQYLLMRRPVLVKCAIHRVGKSRIRPICYVIYFTYFT